MKILETPRLILRQMTVDDAAFMLVLLNDPLWLRFIGDRGVRTLEEARNYILLGAMANYARLGYGFYLVELKETGIAIGMCGLAKRDYLEHADIGFAFLPEYGGQGYAIEAAMATLDYAQHQLHLPRVLATTRLDNDRSSALLEKSGMYLEKIMMHPDGNRELKLYAIDFD
ncbi:GNAT family N-acetyltransferase [Undibacterium flavidum]|uniref:GNAT family N-acetyltransferase n=1 Tax=Undibacterium flavidum TaxID=2762297 RepID=A0ABR6Y8Q6_9BURK|nr:GNAT family N-acetyltransferase [Undibacterium flavidum]MBC3872995.1 GNAT family N-acetyltransferase [Undibacterium flavidum]